MLVKGATGDYFSWNDLASLNTHIKALITYDNGGYVYIGLLAKELENGFNEISMIVRK